MIKVLVHHNVATDEQERPLGMLDGYAARHPTMLVATFTADEPADDLAACEQAFRLFNVGDDPEFGQPDLRAVDYRQRGNRSLSVGDVVEIRDDAGHRYYACARTGWQPIAPPIEVWGAEPVPGTDPLRTAVWL
jgi:hypothetical protein